MINSLAFMFGAAAVCFIVQGGVYSMLSKRVRREWALAYAIVVFVTISTVLGGIGFADGGSPQFLNAFFVYASSSLIATVLILFGIGRKNTNS